MSAPMRTHPSPHKQGKNLGTNESVPETADGAGKIPSSVVDRSVCPPVFQQSAHKQGVLLINLGSPDSTAVSDVRRYLREFLMDPRVIDAPWPIRASIVHGFILPFRPRKSAEAYEKIWTSEGSPLVTLSRSLQYRLAESLGIPVELGMRYQNPSIKSALARLADEGVDEVIVVPLFPHHAASSYESAVERVRNLAKHYTPWMQLSIVPPFFGRPEYIDALRSTAAPYLQRSHDHLLLSFHGIPERHVTKANPECGQCLRGGACHTGGQSDRVCYRRHCLETVRLFTAALPERERSRVSYAFQSRLGMDNWLQPATADVIPRLAHSGVRKLLVMCPAFTVDCLETLEEIGIRGKEAFLQAGGEEFTLIPCLNDSPAWVEALARMINEFTERAANQASNSAPALAGSSY